MEKQLQSLDCTQIYRLDAYDIDFSITEYPMTKKKLLSK